MFEVSYGFAIATISPSMLYSTTVSDMTLDEQWEAVLEKFRLATRLEAEGYYVRLGGRLTCAFCHHYWGPGHCCHGCPIDEAGFHLCTNDEYQRAMDLDGTCVPERRFLEELHRGEV